MNDGSGVGAEMMQRELLFIEPGVYVPIITTDKVVWILNDDSDPLYGVQVDNPMNAMKFVYRVKVSKGNGETLTLLR
jgi:hypothetical protein